MTSDSAAEGPQADLPAEDEQPPHRSPRGTGVAPYLIIFFGLSLVFLSALLTTSAAPGLAHKIWGPRDGDDSQENILFDSSLPFLDREEGIAYFVQVSSQNWKLLPRLLGKIWHSNNVYAIHLDRKISSEDTNQILSFLNEYNGRNLVVMDHRDRVTWAGNSILLNLVSGIGQLLEFRGRWTHLIFVSPANYPLLNQSDMIRLLAQHPGISFVSGSAIHMTEHEWNITCRTVIDAAVFDCDGGITQEVPIPWLAIHPDRVFKGSLWNVLSKQDCEWLMHSPQAQRALVQYMAVVAPEEFFFVTVLANRERSKLSDNSSNYGWFPPRNDFLHHVVWHHPKFKLRTSDHPHILSSIHLFYANISLSGALYARKFDNSKGSAEVLHKIDTEIIGNESFVGLARRRMESACVVGTEGCLSVLP